MFYYRIADVTLQSCVSLPDFALFACDPAEADITLEKTREQPLPGKELVSKSVVHRVTADGWFFHTRHTERQGVYVSRDYRRLRMLGEEEPAFIGTVEWFVRSAMECMLAGRGFVTLHSAAVEVNGEAVAFSGPSGIGKSTRAGAWMDALGAELINGDRPLIDVNNLEVYGVPWDGKEKCYRNVHYPLKAICEVRRSDSAYIREMGFMQRRKLLMRQCFMPMWDTETAAVQMANIVRLAAGANIVRVFSGPGKEDARALYGALENHQTLKEEPDMKAKSGFILRHVVDEYILMPTGDNIGKFNGTVLLNEVSALVWDKLQNPISREDLLKAVVSEFEVDKAVASADLDALLETLRGYGVIEND